MCSSKREGMAGEEQTVRYLIKGGLYLNASQNHTLDKFSFMCPSRATARGISQHLRRKSDVFMLNNVIKTKQPCFSLLPRS